jgi:hypothetical protein
VRAANAVPTWHEPGVSTAISFFTSVWRLAIRRTLAANARVIVGSSPSGTFATSRPIAKTPAPEKLSPATRCPMAMNVTPSPTATSAISRAARLTWSCSGDASSTTVRESAAIRPSCVCIPVP